MSGMQHFDRLVDLWAEHLSSNGQVEYGYTWGRFDEYAASHTLDEECVVRAKEVGRLRVEILTGNAA